MPIPTVIEVTNKTHWKSFFHLPSVIYANNPNWVAPLLMEQRRVFNRKKNPNFKHTIFKAWIIYKENKIAGRIVAFIDSLYTEPSNNLIGFLGFFESINDQLTANELFNVATNWLKNERIDKVYGPMNFSIANECGVQLTGFQIPPMIQMGYTPTYYKLLFENAGFTKAHDLYAYIMSKETVEEQDNLMTRLEIICKKIMDKSEVVLRTINMKDYENELNHINTLYNGFMENNWGFVTSSIEEMLFVGKSMKLIVDPELIFFAEVKGKVVGCSLSIPDFNQVLTHLNGLLFPLGIFKLLYYKRKINQIRIMLLGIDKEYRSRGLDILFYYNTIKRGFERGYNQGELSWISEDNKVLISIVEKMGAKRYKTYRMYEKTL